MDSATQYLLAFGFVTLSAVAVILHAINLRETAANQVAVRAGLPDRLGEEVASMMIRIEAIRLLNMIIFSFAGIGILAGGVFAQAGWLLALLLPIGIWASWRDLISRHRQAEIAGRLILDGQNRHRRQTDQIETSGEDQ